MSSKDYRFATVNKNGKIHHFVIPPQSPLGDKFIETTASVFWLMKSFQRDDWRQERAARRHLERLSFTEEDLENRADIFALNPEELVYKGFITDNLRRAFIEIPLAQGRRFLLRHGLGLSYRQIADKEGCSINTVKQSLRLAKANLRKILRKLEF